MFDYTKSALVCMDTDRLERLLLATPSSDDRDFTIKNWVAWQNRNTQSIVTPMATDTYANIVGMETMPKLTSDEFALLMSTLMTIQDPQIQAIVHKLKMYNDAPSLQTCFDSQGFSSDVLGNVPELAAYETSLCLSAHVRVHPKSVQHENE